MPPRIGIMALESLEGFDDSLAITQVLQEEDETKASGEYDALHVAVKGKLSELEETDLSDATAAESDDGDAASPDADADDAVVEKPADPDTESENDKGNSDTPEKETADDDDNADHDDADPAPEEPQKEKDGKVTSAVTESLRDTYYDRLILESIEVSDVTHALGVAGSAAYDTATYAGRMLTRLSTVLYDLGIQYGPGVISKLKKGVLYLFTKGAGALLSTIIGIGTFIKRYAESIQGTKKDIAQLREIVATLRASNRPLELKEAVYTDSKTIQWLAQNEKGNILGNAKLLNGFMDMVIKNVDNGIMHDLQMVKRLIELSQTGFRGSLLGFLNVAPFQGRFLRRTVKGYVKDPDLVDSLVYSTPLPNKLLFVVNLPRPGLKELESITAAYQESGMFLAVDASFQVTPEEVNYMDLQGVERFLDVLDALCAGAMTRLSLYSRIEKQCGELKFGYKHYYQKLVESKEAASIHTSLVEFVYLKQNFVNKVYLPAAMDIHDYVASYLAHAVRFAKSNLKQLVPTAEPAEKE